MGSSGSPPAARLNRGKCRIYFGYAAGVGKTDAMLADALALRSKGVDCYREASAVDFDLDAALERRPQLILIDGLAHSNHRGARHPKRWQDVEELLAAGIDVFTTLNVLNLDSLKDVVRGITHVSIRETVPDTFFDHADEVQLVDRPVDELLAGLHAETAHAVRPVDHAAELFQKGNLMALRELALRRAADRVMRDVRAYRADRSIGSVWKTAASILTCIGPDGAEGVVRAAARLASQLNAGWHAVYVETPQLQRLPLERRENILGILNLAKELGAITAVIPDSQVAESLIAYARAHNLSKLVIGRDPKRRLWPWQRSQGQTLALLAPDIDLVQIGADHRSWPETLQEGAGTSPPLPEADLGERRLTRLLRYASAAAACAAVTAFCMPLAGRFDRSNIVAIFLLAVVLVAVRFGRGPAALAAVLSVGAFDFFFVPPRFSFAVSDFQYLLTFLVMLAVGLITGQLTAGLRFKARLASHREERAGSLYAISRDLSAAMEIDEVVHISAQAIERTFRASAVIMLPDKQGHLATISAGPWDAGLDVQTGIAQWAFEKGQPAGFSTDTLPGSDVLYLPLRAPIVARGVLAVKAEDRRLLRFPEQRQLLDTFAALIAIALERVHYVDVAQEALLKMESERLRNSLLAAVSHDLRTPLTVLQGLAELLAMNHPPLAAAQLEAAELMQEEARRMSALVNNLLDMARIERGEVKLHLEWQPFEEVVGAATNATEQILKKHQMRLSIAQDLPLIEIDATLITRVLVNLLENAAKYTPAGSTVELSATVAGDQFSVSVADTGPGLPAGREDEIFQKFTRGARESNTRGVGLGLTICRAIIESHRGKIVAGNRPGGGAIFTFTLPLGFPPAAAAEPGGVQEYGGALSCP